MDTYQLLTPSERALLESFFEYDDGRRVLFDLVCGDDGKDEEILTGIFNIVVDRVAGTITLENDLGWKPTGPETYNISILRDLICS